MLPKGTASIRPQWLGMNVYTYIASLVATDHPLQFELMHYLSRYAHIVSDVCWKLKLHHKHLNKFSVTTLTCQVQGTATILQVWDTTYDTVDSERQRTG